VVIVQDGGVPLIRVAGPDGFSVTANPPTFAATSDSIVVCNRNGGSLTIFPEPAATPVTLASTTPLQAVLSDVNGDGLRDLVTLDAFDNAVEVRLGDGLGHFGAAQLFGVPPAEQPSSIAVFDLNGDRIKDVVVGSENAAPLRVFYGTLR
jgi:hypothetical protein